MTMMMAVNTIKIKKGRADEVLARFAEPKAVHTYEGFVWMEVLKSDTSDLDYDEIKVCTTWEDESYFKAWAESGRTRRMHKESPTAQVSEDEKPTISAELTTFEVVHRHAPAK